MSTPAWVALYAVDALWWLWVARLGGARAIEGGAASWLLHPVAWRCAVAFSAEITSLVLVVAGAVLPAVIVVVRWLRKRARRSARTASAGEVGSPVVERRAPAMLDPPTSSALRVRVPSRRRRLVAWLAVLGWNGASWLVPRVFWLSAAASTEGRQVFAVAAIPITWWLLEETRFHPRTLAVAMPLFVIGHWSLLLTFLALNVWRVVGFGP